MSEQVQPTARIWSDAEIGDDFDYVPVSPWAPISLVAGIASLTALLNLFGLYLAIFGALVGLAAVLRIRSSLGTVKGQPMAAVGLLLASLSVVGGGYRTAHAYRHEVPEGFRRVHFPKEIAELQFVYINGKRKIPAEVAAMVGQKVYLKGFMWATQDTEGLTRFILLKDNGECCFGGRPKSHDFITVTLNSYPEGQRPALASRAPGMSDKILTAEEQQTLGAKHQHQLATKAFVGMVAVAGVLNADPKAGEGGEPADFEFAPVYTMDAELVEEAWTPF